MERHMRVGWTLEFQLESFQNVGAIALDTIEWRETPKGTVRDEEELNTRLGI
jgi:hypothetical protein